jgi:hypothetical protein
MGVMASRSRASVARQSYKHHCVFSTLSEEGRRRQRLRRLRSLVIRRDFYATLLGERTFRGSERRIKMIENDAMRSYPRANLVLPFRLADNVGKMA